MLSKDVQLHLSSKLSERKMCSLFRFSSFKIGTSLVVDKIEEISRSKGVIFKFQSKYRRKRQTGSIKPQIQTIGFN